MTRGQRRPNAAIYYQPANFSTASDRLTGRLSANEGLLRAFLRFGGVDCFYCHAARESQYDEFNALCAKLADYNHETRWIPFIANGELETPGCLFRAAPNIAELAWQRAAHGDAHYSLCGITHAIAEYPVIDRIADLMIAPVREWDALICTSQAIKQVIVDLLEEWGDYLGARFDAARPAILPQLPVIPLGIDCAEFAPSGETGPWCAAFRSQHAIAADDIVFLYVGRLNPVEKSNPAPLYLALEKVAKALGRTPVFIQAGWFSSEQYQDLFIKGARELAPSVKHIFLDGRAPDIRRHIWHVADIFLSLPDNIQESFGLTPLEAMAAGLPVVASDWDGYRDTIRDGQDGFLIPTSMPVIAAGDDIARRYATRTGGYGGYCASTSQAVAVDIDACADRCVQLARDPELRRAMGACGQARARTRYDWPHIISSYQALWAELAARRMAAATQETLQQTKCGNITHDPRRQDPFLRFSTYPSRPLTGNTRLALHPAADAQTRSNLRNNGLVRIAGLIFLDDEEADAVLDFIAASNSCRLDDVCSAFAQLDVQTLIRTVGWMLKYNLLTLDETAS